MKRKIIIGLTIVLSLGFFSFIGYILLVYSAFGVFDKRYSNDELINHYQINKNKFREFENYIRSVIPKNKLVRLEYKDNHELAMFQIITLDTSLADSIFCKYNYPIYTERELIINKDISDSLLASISWTRKTIGIIKQKLDKIECTGFESGNPLQIMFQRCGLGSYYYYFYESIVSDSLKHVYQKEYDIHLIGNKVAWTYHGGAID